ncbi:unnamed protein product [Urochloa decumbens]|uniref:Uncharacterized protein n=1 Tax=Urochloa decumbens TaxID=240449 RepID=A0ABC9AHR5_9POAL
MGEGRGNIAFFGTYRPPVPLDIFSRAANPSGHGQDELLLTDGESYNQNGQPIPPAALREILAFLGKDPKLAAELGETKPEDANTGRVTGLLFVSERDNGLETLHVALRFSADDTVKVLRLADIYGAEAFGGTRMEDSGCIAGGFKVGARTVGYCLVYVSTKEAVKDCRTPWTVVYKTNLADGHTERLTPPGRRRAGWAAGSSSRTAAGRRGGSDNVIFFHRGFDTTLPNGTIETKWRVFRHEISTGRTHAVTPEDCFKAITPAAISETKVAVATIWEKSEFSDNRVEKQYRHIEIFNVNDPGNPVKITQKMRPKADHYSPFVLDGGSRIGYHRCRTDKLLEIEDESQTYRSVERKFHRVQAPETHRDVGLFRVSGVFPTISKNGEKLAFVDKEFRSVWLTDSCGLREVYTVDEGMSIFSTSWNQNDQLDTLYVCEGPAFSVAKTVQIYMLAGVSGPEDDIDKRRLTAGDFNNAFPSSSPDGTRLVFRSTRDRVAKEGNQRKYKNLFIIDAIYGEFGGGVPATDQGLDPGYFAVYLVNADDLGKGELPVPVRVIRSWPTLAGHINHPVFSPDMRTIVFAADLAAVTVDPISMPLFLHSVRPYGDIFTVDLRDGQDIGKNKDISGFHRITHSRYEYSTPAWAAPADGDHDANAKWKLPSCSIGAAPMARPYAYPTEGEGWHVSGHLTIGRRCC